MLVEFDTVRSCLKESFERQVEADLNGDISVSFYRQNDYKTQMTIEMNRIIDFTSGRVFLNQQQYECVYGYDQDGTMTPNLLISYQDFKRMYELHKSIKIPRHEEL